MRDIHIMARALAGEFGSAQRLADELRLVVRREDVSEGVVGLYVPPRGRRRRALLLLGRSVDAGLRQQLLTCALAHHFLRHRALPWYGYGPDGPRHGDSRAAREVADFVAAFDAAVRPAPPVRLFRDR